MKDDFINKDIEELAFNSAREISEYNALFNLC
jgi:hypothetical protein